MKIAVIPARGGSKRIPRKNIKIFCGKPMIAWSIDVAKATGLFGRIIVSTDDLEIAAVSKSFGAEVPFLRPAELSDDYAGTTEVVAHTIRWAIDQGLDLEAVCCIYATAPFVRAADIMQSWDTIALEGGACSFPVTDYAAPIFRSFSQLPTGGVEMFFPEHYATRSQDLPCALHDAGQFYWARPSYWLSGADFYGSSARPIVIPRWRVQDIDTQDDWERAEIMQNILTRTRR
jgi:pseudaminic acid cytidylyltransferase